MLLLTILEEVCFGVDSGMLVIYHAIIFNWRLQTFAKMCQMGQVSLFLKILVKLFCNFLSNAVDIPTDR